MTSWKFVCKMKPEEEEMLANLRNKVQNNVRFASLKIMCARKVADYIWPEYAKRGLTKLSSVLPKSLCSLVYQEFLGFYDFITQTTHLSEKWQNLHFFLIMQRVQIFARDGLEAFDCKILEVGKIAPYAQQLFAQLAEGSPNLKSLKDHRFAATHRNSVKDRISLSDFYSLNSMSKLEVLEIKCYPAKDADLQVIGTCLPLLQRLMLYAAPKQGSKISIRGLKSLAELKFLKHLTFEVESDDHVSVQLVKNCLRLMPQVNTVAVERGSFDVAHEFPEYKDPVEFGLEHLVLNAKSKIPSNVVLPNVTQVTVQEKVTMSLKQFKKLDHLFFSSDEYYTKFNLVISEVGLSLRKLHVAFHFDLDLMQVFQLCPELHTLILNEVTFQDNFNVSQLKSSVQSLRVFKLDEPGEYGAEDCFESCGLLHLLLSCPELEELQIHTIKLSKAELELINEELESGALAIKKLKKVDIKAFIEEQDAIASYAEFACKLCVKNCTILKEVSICECFDQYKRQMLLADQMQDAITRANIHKFRNVAQFSP